MVRFDNQMKFPLVAWQSDQPILFCHIIRYDSQIRLVKQNHFRDIVCLALQKRKPDFRIFLYEIGNNFRQEITCLGMCRRNCQTAGILSGIFLADPFQIVDFLHNQFDRIQNHSARLRQTTNTFSMTPENIDSQLILKFNNRFGNPGLGCKQRFGSFGQIEILPYCLTNKS